MRGMEIQINEVVISKVSCLLVGPPWDKEDRQPATDAKKLFLLSYEELEENKNGVKRESLPGPWDEVAYHMLKYIICEGRLSMLYAYHFIFLHHLRNLFHQIPKENLNIPYFLLQYLRHMSYKVNNGNE
jgi:hypothetical protein